MAGDDFDRFCRDAYPSIVRLAYFVSGDRHEAEEIAQETLARAFARWTRVRSLAAPEAWARRVAANLAISARRRTRVRMAHVPDRDRTVELPEPPDPALMDALRTLTPAQRVVVVLRYMDDRSVEDVAAELGKAPGTVRALAAQGAARLRARLTYEEVHDDA